MLLAHHQALLVASAISPEVVEARGYFSAQSTKAELGRLGFGPSQRLIPALIIPQWNVLGECTHHMLRADAPREVRGKAVKYETPTKATQVLDVPPAARAMLEDPAVPLVITEGSRKADAAVSRGMCAVSLNGVYGFRGTNDKGGKSALPDWELIALNGRTVLLAFDNDALTKPTVHEALRRLRGLLEMRRAVVRVVVFPPDPSGRKVGMDDWLAGDESRGFAELDGLAVAELPPLEQQREPAESFDDIDDEPGWVVLEDVAAFIDRHVHFSTEHHTAAVAAWIGHTHALDNFDFTPRLHLRSAVKRSGKSRMLEVIEQVARRAVQAVNITPAVLFRMMEAEQPTVLIDEVDQLLGGDEHTDGEPSPLIGLINGGFRRGNQVWRMVGQGADLKYQSFNVFGAVALAGIGRVADTIADRSITVNLERLPAGHHVESFRHREVVETTTALRRRLAAWTSRHDDELRAARPAMPDGVIDRAADIWEPLIAVADIAGGRWPTSVRAAATHMVAAHLVEDSDATLPVRLLADVLVVWSFGADRMRSRELVDALNGLDDSPWADMRRGSGITMNWLANRLRPFGVSSRNVRESGNQGKGYYWDELVPVWDRYGLRTVDQQQDGSSGSGEPSPASHTSQTSHETGTDGTSGTAGTASQTVSSEVVVDASSNGHEPAARNRVFRKAGS